ncbi:hypothetical protein [Microcoleus sp. FACHB-68]|uniref:hypothetical protein n=1 Tax=Microcoleus sp. FACHB-68 TaxID=2692826 RepID=UPI00168448C8|nr:hypothetical protein [Microcoleus sp. FACHB-68]MBD1939799.1 hypothetical protein [Microcoleus sp. FACHB-68]
MKKIVLTTIDAIRTPFEPVGETLFWSGYGLIYGAITGFMFTVQIETKPRRFAIIWRVAALIAGTLTGAIAGALLGAFGGAYFKETSSSRRCQFPNSPRHSF